MKKLRNETNERKTNEETNEKTNLKTNEETNEKINLKTNKEMWKMEVDKVDKINVGKKDKTKKKEYVANWARNIIIPLL